MVDMFENIYHVIMCCQEKLRSQFLFRFRIRWFDGNTCNEVMMRTWRKAIVEGNFRYAVLCVWCGYVLFLNIWNADIICKLVNVLNFNVNCHHEDGRTEEHELNLRYVFL